MPDTTTIRDINGRETKPGDLIRVFHYIDARTRRKCYMHKLVVGGAYLYCADITDIWRKGSLNGAHKCRLIDVDEFEIIDGPSEHVGGVLQTWYERPRVEGAKL